MAEGVEGSEPDERAGVAASGRHARERSSRGGAGHSTRARAAFGALWGWRAYVLAVAACAGLVAGWFGWPAFEAARGAGQPGIFTAVEYNGCSRGIFTPYCTWSGTFDSDDGLVHLDSVLLEHAVPDRAGDEVAVLYEGPSHDVPTVYLANGDRTWIGLAVVFVLSAGYLLALVAVHTYVLVLLIRERRSSPQAR